jgi:hypothetical protein
MDGGLSKELQRTEVKGGGHRTAIQGEPHRRRR